MNLFAAFEEKISVKAATLPNEQNIFAKVNASLSYYKAYEKLESSNFQFDGPYIFHNGYSNQSLLSSDETFYGTNEFQLSLKISNYQGEQAGEYSVVVYTNSRYALDTFDDCYDYDSFAAEYLRVRNVIWYTEVLHIYTAGETITIAMECA